MDANARITVVYLFVEVNVSVDPRLFILDYFVVLASFWGLSCHMHIPSR